MKQFPNISNIDPSSLDGLNHLGKFLKDIQLFQELYPLIKMALMIHGTILRQLWD